MVTEVGKKKCRSVEYKSCVYLIGGYINNKFNNTLIDPPTMIKVHDTPITLTTTLSKMIVPLNKSTLLSDETLYLIKTSQSISK